MTDTVETRTFQAETKQLLELMIHSLYTDKEIFLRELISNASDALDRFRLEAIVDPTLSGGDEGRAEIRLSADPARRTLTIQDNGIGMSRDEVIANLGTIARSGTRELRESLRGSPSPQDAPAMIGRFGVGFYSAFMVAGRIDVVTRRAGADRAVHWQSDGTSGYDITDADRAGHGTTITLHLREPNPDAGLEDFTDKWRLATLVKKYSDFIGYPIVFTGWREEPIADAPGTPPPGERSEAAVEDKVLNSMKPLWMKAPQDVTAEEYRDAYRHLAHDWQDPLKVLTYRAEGLHEYVAMLFIPAQAQSDLYYHASEPGLRLFSQCVMVLDKTPDLLPRYLRFLRGVVDATDLPLNISRQRLQQDRDIMRIRGWLTRKVLDSLRQMQEQEPDTYTAFWQHFGRALKEGIDSDRDNRERLLDLLQFPSSHDPAAPTTLHAYVDRMPAEQDQIYYLAGESRAIVERSPHLEAILDKGYEVLYFVDQVDELVAHALPEFKGKKLKSVGKGQVSLGSEEERKAADAEIARLRGDLEDLLQALQKHLTTWVKEVRLSTRLLRTPACLVVDDHEYSPQLERLLRGHDAAPRQRRVLELNPKHAVTQKMLERFRADANDPGFERMAHMLFNAALLAEGSELPDAVTFTQTLHEVLEHGV